MCKLRNFLCVGVVFGSIGCSSDGTESGATAASNGEPEEQQGVVLVDDMEGTEAPNGPIALAVSDATRMAGYWFYAMSTGSEQNALAPSPLSYSELESPRATEDGGTSGHAIHVTCTIADRYGYCNVGVWFAQPTSADSDSATSNPAGASTAQGNPEARILFDISRFSAVTFFGMSSLRDSVKVMISNRDTDPVGAQCGVDSTGQDQCWDSFSWYVELTDTWQRFTVPFDTIKQEGWGHQAPSGAFDPSTAYMLIFQANGPSSAGQQATSVDFWIDDIYLE
jgi:hypothetical protein